MKLPTNPLLTLLLCWFTTFGCLGQMEVKKPFEVNFIPEKIKASGIRSVVVNAELGEDAKNVLLPTSGKIAEGEFDVNGNLSYYIKADNNNSSPFFMDKKSCAFDYFDYDENGKRIALHSESVSEMREEQKRFDESGQITELIQWDEGVKVGHATYEWSEGKMVGWKILLPADVVVRYDEQGRLISTDKNGVNTTMKYIVSGDTLKAEYKVFQLDSLFLESEMRKLISSNREVYSKTECPRLPTLNSTIIHNYDEQGNVIEHRVIVEPENIDQPENSIIENSYNTEGLLVKRIFYDVQDGKRKWTKTEVFTYKKEPLKDKRPKGYLRGFFNEEE